MLTPGSNQSSKRWQRRGQRSAGRAVLNRRADDPQPGLAKWRRAARIAGITSAGAALMAVMQISNPLGLTLLLNLGAPELAFSVMAGVSFLACAALLQWLALALAGSLVTWPVAHLSAFIILSIVTSYLIYALPGLGRLWIWIQVPVLTGFYMIVLQPGAVGADNVQMFGGVTIAVMLLLLCNRLFWPKPAALTLEESTGEMLHNAHRRLHELMAGLNGDAAGEPRDCSLASRLGFHLTLLGPSARQAHTLTEAAELLLRVIVAERVRDEIEDRAAAITIIDLRSVSAMGLSELRAMAEAVDGLLEEHTITGNAYGKHPQNEARGFTADDLTERSTRLGAEEPDLRPLTELIAALAQILAIDPLERPAAGTLWAGYRLRPANAVVNRFLLRFSIRHTLALTIAFLIGLWDNAAALHAALWLLMLGGPPSHGATVRKFAMRALGSAGALLIATAATIVLAPNFGSLLPYASAIFAGTLPLAYAGESEGIISYVAIGGTAFVIAFSGPGPRPDLAGSIWTIWGISLGMVIRAVVSALWPERPGRTLAEQFQGPLEAIVTLLSGTAQDPPKRELNAACEAQLMDGIGMILAVANDARLEGSHAMIDASELIAAADQLLRLGCLLGHIRSLPDEDPIIEARLDLELIRNTYVSWLKYLRAVTDGQVKGHAPLRAMVLAHRAEDRADSSAPLRQDDLASVDHFEAKTEQNTDPLRRLTCSLGYHLIRIARQSE